MSEKKVEELTEYINSEKTNNSLEENKLGIGIRNVNQRIKLTCGNEYGIVIKSSEKQGTCFTIFLPLISGGDL
jgi:sensor histidine kinase YesM